jgi:hypothetical protein
MIPYRLILQFLFVLLQSQSKLTHFLINEISCPLHNIFFPQKIIYIENCLWILFILPEHTSEKGNQFNAKRRSLYFEPSVFFQSNFALNCSLEWRALVDQRFDINPDEEMVVLVVLQSYAVAHQQQTIGQSAITEIHLGASFELVLDPTYHQKFIKFVFRPRTLKVILLWIHLILFLLDLLIFPDFLLPQTICVSIGPNFIEKFLDQLKVFDISRVKLNHLLHGCPLVLLKSRI